MADLKDITHKVSAVQVTGPKKVGPVPAYTDGDRFFFADAEIAVLASALTGTDDLAGRTVRIRRTKNGWEEKRGKKDATRLHERTIKGVTHYRLDDEWLFTPVAGQGEKN